MIRRAFAALCAVLFVAASTAELSSAQILGIGGGSRRPQARMLERVRANEFTPECQALAAGLDQVAAGGSGLAVDLIDLAVGAPPVARESVVILPATGTMAYLQQILRRFQAVQAAPAGVTPKIWIQESLQIDARQRERGDIYLTRGLINAIRDPARLQRGVTPAQIDQELAFVIAHEYAHILACHYNRVIQSERRRQMLGMGATLGVTLMFAKTLRFQDVGGQPTLVAQPNSGFEQDVVQAMTGYTVLQTFNSSLITPSWAGSQEREADWLAVELMREAGYGTEHVNQLLTELRAADGAFAQQMTVVLEQIPTQSLQAAMIASTTQSAASFGDMMRGIGVRSGLDMINRWRERQRGHFHDDPDERAENIGRMLTFMGVADQPPPSSAFAAAAGVFLSAAAQEMSVAELALDANRRIYLEDVPGGCSSATRALAAGPTAPVALNAAANCELARNNLPRAGVHFTALTRSNFSTPEDFVVSAEIWSRSANRARAIASLDAGARRFGKDAFYLPRMQVLAHLGDVAGVRAAGADCAINAETADLREQCPVIARQLTEPPPPEGQTAQGQGQQNSMGGLMNSLRNLPNPLGGGN